MKTFPKAQKSLLEWINIDSPQNPISIEQPLAAASSELFD